MTTKISQFHGSKKKCWKIINFDRPCEHYEIGVPIGQGKYSEVYDGMDTTNDNKVVIKVLKPGK